MKGLSEALHEAKMRLSGQEETPACSEGKHVLLQISLRKIEHAHIEQLSGQEETPACSKGKHGLLQKSLFGK